MTPPVGRSRRQKGNRWGVILAGGDGLRLRQLTRLVSGDDRPKQFCPLLGSATLLQETRQRAERSICADQILYSLTLAHQEYYLRDLLDRRAQAVVQPCNRGTAPAILSALLHIRRLDSAAVVAILPSDHYYSHESVFTAALDRAFAVAQVRSDSIVMLGAQPKSAEVEYGWIEVGDSVGVCPDVFHVKGFQEKPPRWMAQRLLQSGSYWNTFVMVGQASAFLEAGREWLPDLFETLTGPLICSTVEGEMKLPDWLYDRIAHADFSRQVLSPGARRLVTLRLGTVDWNDLGDPGRVLASLAERNTLLPGWVTRWRAEESNEHGAVQSASGAHS